MAYAGRNYAARSYADGYGPALPGLPGTTRQNIYWQTDLNAGPLLVASRGPAWQTDLNAYLVPSRSSFIQTDENFGFVLTHWRQEALQVDENFSTFVPLLARDLAFEIDENFIEPGAGGAGTYGGWQYGLLVYAQFLVRAIEETLVTGDAAERTVFYVRTATESAPAVDATESGAIMPRASTDTAPASDSATRSVSFERIAGDAATADDLATRLIFNFRTASDEAGATDSAQSFSLIIRNVPESAPAFDAAVRAVIYYRSLDESAPAADEADRTSLLYRRAADDAAPAEDDAAIRMVYFIRLADDAPVTDDFAQRNVNYFRALVENAGAMDAVVSFVTAFRVAEETIPTPTDVATQFVTFGPPNPTIVFTSGDKVGIAAPADRVTMQFEFDKHVFAWEVRANSTGPHDGNRIAGWRSVSGETVDRGEVEITAEDLVHGGNQIVVYGFTNSGGWSPHPLP